MRVKDWSSVLFQKKDRYRSIFKYRLGSLSEKERKSILSVPACVAHGFLFSKQSMNVPYHLTSIYFMKDKYEV